MAKTVRLLNVNEIQNSSGNVIQNIPNIADGHSKSASHAWTTCGWASNDTNASGGHTPTYKMSFADRNSNSYYSWTNGINGIHKVRAPISGSDGSQMLVLGGINDSKDGYPGMDGIYRGSHYNGAPDWGNPNRGNASADYTKFQYSSDSSSVSQNVLDECALCLFHCFQGSDGTHIIAPEANFPTDINNWGGAEQSTTIAPWSMGHYMGSSFNWRMYVRRSFADPAVKNTSWGSAFEARETAGAWCTNGTHILLGGGAPLSGGNPIQSMERKAFASSDNAVYWMNYSSIHSSYGSDGYIGLFNNNSSPSNMKKVSFDDNSQYLLGADPDPIFNNTALNSRGCTDGTTAMGINAGMGNNYRADLHIPSSATSVINSTYGGYQQVGISHMWHANVHSGTA